MITGNKVKIIENISYNADMEYAYKYSRWLLLAAACWPVSKKKRFILWLCFRLLNIVQLIFMLGFIITMFLSLFYNDLRKSEQAQEIGIVTICIGFTFKYLFLISKSKTYQFCVEQINDDWRYIFRDSRNIMLRYAKKTRKYILILSFFLCSAWISWQAAAVVKKPSVHDNMTFFELPMPAHFYFFDARHLPYYYCGMAFQSVAILILLITLCNICTPLTYVIHICGQYKVLESLVRKFGYDNYNSKNLAYIRLIVKKHYKIIR